MATITYIYGKQQKKVKGKKGETILQIALDGGVPVEHACGGNGFCTTCICKVQDGGDQLSERNDREENMGVVSDPDRLSCQAKLEGDGDITIEIVNA